METVSRHTEKINLLSELDITPEERSLAADGGRSVTYFTG